MTTSTSTPIRLTCVAIVLEGRVIPVTNQMPVIVEDDDTMHESLADTNDTRELIPVLDRTTQRTLEIAAIGAAIDTMIYRLDQRGQKES